MLFVFLNRSFCAAALGFNPECRHDFIAFMEVENQLLVAGETLKCIFAVIYIKSDWSEFNGSFGFPAWNDNLRPCFRCPADVETFYNFRPISAMSCGGCIENHVDDYFRA